MGGCQPETVSIVAIRPPDARYRSASKRRLTLLRIAMPFLNSESALFRFESFVSDRGTGFAVIATALLWAPSWAIRLQPGVCNDFTLDAPTFGQHGLGSVEIDVSGREAVDFLLVTKQTAICGPRRLSPRSQVMDEGPIRTKVVVFQFRKIVTRRGRCRFPG